MSADGQVSPVSCVGSIQRYASGWCEAGCGRPTEDNDSDLNIVSTNWGLREGEAGWDARADPNADGVCNVFDLVVVLANWGNTYP